MIAGVPFSATLWMFGNTKLVEHLPVYRAMLAVLVFRLDPALRGWTDSLWPWRRRPVEDGTAAARARRAA